jgi:hypothetical protein
MFKLVCNGFLVFPTKNIMRRKKIYRVFNIDTESPSMVICSINKTCTNSGHTIVCHGESERRWHSLTEELGKDHITAENRRNNEARKTVRHQVFHRPRHARGPNPVQIQESIWDPSVLSNSGLLLDQRGKAG